MTKNSLRRKIRVGVIGVGRGQSFMQGAANTGMELVAICDTWKERLKEAGDRYKVKTYTDYDKFLKHDMDAVVLANYCHDHAPFAVKALKAGLHVMSECIAARTMAQCVELVEAVEQSGRIYMLAENYPYTLFCQELRRVYRTGEIGAVRQEDRALHHVLQRSAAAFQDQLQVLNRAPRLLPDVAGDNLLRDRIHGNLAGNEDEPAGPYRR